LSALCQSLLGLYTASHISYLTAADTEKAAEHSCSSFYTYTPQR